jgi:hypothetical protein
MKLMIALGIALLFSTACIAQDRENQRPGIGVEIGPGGVRVEPQPGRRPERYGHQRCKTVITIDEEGHRMRQRVCRDY